MVSNAIVIFFIIGLALFGLEKFSRGMHYGASFLAYAIWVPSRSVIIKWLGVVFLLYLMI